MEKVVPCEKCGKDTIKIVVTPRSKTYKGGHYEGSEMVLTKECPKCGHRQGTLKKLSHEDRIKRMKESGLPTVIEEL